MKREFAKMLGEIVALVAVAPALLMYAIKARILGSARAYAGISQRASRWEGLFGIYRRRALFQVVAANVGRNVVISYGTLLNKQSTWIGDNVYIGGYCVLGDIRVGANTLIADQVVIPSGSAQHGVHRLDMPMRQQPGTLRTITIGQDCWIGAGAIVMENVGSHCIVAAGAVVTSPVPDFKIVAGCPARVIGDRREHGPESIDASCA